MYKKTFIYFTFLINVVFAVKFVAITKLSGEGISGLITFSETDEGLHVHGTITGKEEGQYGLHVHELGNLDTCYTTGTHFNPNNNDHAGRHNETRHVGDLGNVQFDETSTAALDFVDNVVTLRGRNSILGRSLVLHENEDDLGAGDDEGSKLTGNAGGRVACGVIGILSPADPWNGATSFSVPVLLLATFTFLNFIRL